MQRRQLIIISSLAVIGPLSLILLIGGGAWIATKVSIYQQAAATLPAERLAAQKAGILVGGEDFIRMQKAPAGHNAADAWEEITRRMTARPVPKDMSDAMVVMLDGEDTPADRLNARKALKQYAPEIRLAEQAAATPVCRFQLNDQLFIYHRTEAGFMLYSIGENFHDDGGNLRQTDIGIAYPSIYDIPRSGFRQVNGL